MGDAIGRDPRKEIAFLISVSGAGIPAAETTIDEAKSEMAAIGLRPEAIQRVVGLMKLQYEFARTGRRWDEYAAARAQMIARMGSAPSTFPGNAERSLLAVYPKAILLRSRAYTTAASDAGARIIWRIGRQHLGREEQERLGGGLESRKQPRLYVSNHPTRESSPA